MSGKPTYEELELLAETQQKQIAEMDKLLSIFPGMICIAGTDGYFKYLNSEWEKTLGHSLEELLSRPLFDFIHPDDIEATLKEVEKQISGKSTFNFENRYRCKDGFYKTLEWRATPSVDGKLYAIASDISERKRAEEELQERGQLYRTILETAMDGFWIVDTEGRLLEVNASYCQMSGYSREELLQMRVSDIEVIETPDAVIRHMKKVIAKGEDRFETCHRHKDGRILDMEVSVLYRPAEHGRMVSFIRDITEMKRQEEDIRLRSLVLDQIHDQVTITDLNGVITYVNQTQVKKSGSPKEQLLGRTTTIYGEDSQHGATHREILEKTLSDGSWRGEVVNFTADGGERFMDCRTQIIYDTHGVPKALCGIATDITERKQVEAELLNNEKRLTRAEIASKSGNWEFHLDSQQMIGSEGASKIYGVDKNRVEYAIVKNIPLPEYRPLLDVALKKLIENNEPYDIEFKIKAADTGEIKDIHSIALFDREKRIIFGIIQDVTDRRKADEEKARLESRLQQAQKMEAIGLLAGGIAHDLNNILFPVSGLSEMLLDVIPSENPWHGSIKQIHQSALRGSDLVKQILALSRQSNLEKMPLRIQPVLKEVLNLFRATIPQQIQITSHIDMNCGMIFADQTQIHQIMMNLITNAYHAVEQTGGTIHVGLKESAIEEVDAIEKLIKSGRYACITVGDTGVGIDPSMVDQIFTPYFTTKEQGKGTGIGLSVVHGIVKEYGGDIRVVSEVGKGTLFYIYLPLLEDVKDKKIAAVGGKHPTGSERILLIDDEEPIALMLQMMLKRLGYQVIARTSSLDALKDFRADPSKFDLVISDRSMPNMTGVQLAQELIAIRPDIPIIVCTGFADEKDEQFARAAGVKDILIKPVAIADLAAMVRKVLDDNLEFKDRYGC